MKFFGYDESYLLGLAAWGFLLLAMFWAGLHLRRSARRKKRSLVPGNLVLALWIVAVPLTGLEIYLAVFYDSTDSFNMSLVSKQWFTRHVEPFQYPLKFRDGQGLVYRDSREYQRPELDVTHVCFLGDSFTFGHGVPDVDLRFSNRIRMDLEEHCRGSVMVSNFADAGTDLHWVEAAIRKLVENDHALDVVVYTMCLNDIETFHPDHVRFYEELGSHGPRFLLFRRSYLFNLAYFRVRQFTVPQVRGYYQFVQDYYDGDPWLRMSSKLRDLSIYCRSHGISLRVVIFPFLHNLGDDYPFAEAHRQIRDFCQDESIPVKDLLPVLLPHQEENLVVNRFDAHPNERAHELAARAIRKDLLADICPSDSP